MPGQSIPETRPLSCAIQKLREPHAGHVQDGMTGAGAPRYFEGLALGGLVRETSPGKGKTARSLTTQVSPTDRLRSRRRRDDGRAARHHDRVAGDHGRTGGTGRTAGVTRRTIARHGATVTRRPTWPSPTASTATNAAGGKHRYRR